jgi:hypothetical protein
MKHGTFRKEYKLHTFANKILRKTFGNKKNDVHQQFRILAYKPWNFVLYIVHVAVIL